MVVNLGDHRLPTASVKVGWVGWSRQAESAVFHFPLLGRKKPQRAGPGSGRTSSSGLGKWPLLCLSSVSGGNWKEGTEKMGKVL